MSEELAEEELSLKSELVWNYLGLFSSEPKLYYSRSTFMEKKLLANPKHKRIVDIAKLEAAELVHKGGCPELELLEYKARLLGMEYPKTDTTKPVSVSVGARQTMIFGETLD